MSIYTVDWRDSFPPSCREGFVSIGNFDGAHRGHAHLIAELVRHAKKMSPAVVITFDPHPIEVLRPGTRVELLTTPKDRAKYLHQLGADAVITLRATPELFALEARAFFDEVIRDRLAARGLVEGSNFRFGHDRLGDSNMLGTMCREAGMQLSVISPVVWEGIEVSSSRIRTALLDGEVELAAKLLQRPYTLRGTVGEGMRRGRTIGFPTANLERVATVVPGGGVYSGSARLTDGETYPAAVNIGTNPTFAEEIAKIEVHLIGYQGDLYDQELEVAFLTRLRETRPFASVKELTEQLHHDVERATAIFKEKRDGQ
jgi:riboflavin kinase/FMN adenylyltransferase